MPPVESDPAVDDQIKRMKDLLGSMVDHAGAVRSMIKFAETAECTEARAAFLEQAARLMRPFEAASRAIADGVLDKA